MAPARSVDIASGLAEIALSRPERSLLVVDDDTSVRHALSITFRDLYNVKLAESGSDAVELFRQNPTDVALLDIHMPGMSGLQVLKQLKEVDPAVEVILLTGYETIEYVREAMRLGACEYITKPYIVDDLRASVQSAMARRQTSRKTAAYAQQLTQLQNEIHHQQMREELARTRNQIYASIIHDVTSPLTAIAGYCELMQHTVANAEMLEADQLSKVRKQAQLISRNVSNCIDLSRRYLGFLEGSFSAKSQSSINEVFYDLAELLEAYPKVRAKQLIIQPLPADRQLAMHRTDLLQVLLNLTINALQCAVEYHRVEVSASPLDPSRVPSFLQNGPGVYVLKSPQFNESLPLLAISVQDNGPGIPEHLLSKIFEPYFTTKPPGQGSGLGLAIAQRLVLHAQGAIHLTSRPGEGSTFALCIPLQPQ
jgi:two-component system, sensor histidine kinase and response regulator